jgi:hypothetical protein
MESQAQGAGHLIRQSKKLAASRGRIRLSNDGRLNPMDGKGSNGEQSKLISFL